MNLDALANAACEDGLGSTLWHVYCDALEERGVDTAALRVPFWNLDKGGDGGGYGDGGGGYGGGGGGYGDGGDGGGGYGGYGGGDGYGGGGGGYGGGYGDGDDYGGVGGYGNGNTTFKGIIMHPGLSIIVRPAGYYPYVQIGWLRQVDGLEWELHGARVLRRFGSSAQLVNLAAKGPAKDTELLDASAEPESVFRPHVVRAIVANPKAWAKECPMPAGWKE